MARSQDAKGITVRLARKADVRPCYRLGKVKELAPPNKRYAELWWIRDFVKERAIFFVAEMNRNIVGFVMGERTTGDVGLL